VLRMQRFTESPSGLTSERVTCARRVQQIFIYAAIFRYASAEEALPHIQAIVLQEQEAASARASRGEVDATADGDADATASAASASEDKAVNVCCMLQSTSVMVLTRMCRLLPWLLLSKSLSLAWARRVPLLSPRRALRKISWADPSPRCAMSRACRYQSFQYVYCMLCITLTPVDRARPSWHVHRPQCPFHPREKDLYLQAGAFLFLFAGVVMLLFRIY
jgi:hypothetical protein